MSTKWKEPYASASLNQRFVGVIASGIYRGLVLQPDPSLGDRTVLVQVDPIKADHVAVFEGANGYSISYRDGVSGNITLSLTSYASVDVVICIFITYAPGLPTTGSYRVYTVTEFNALSAAIQNELVVLGTVTVPASGAIPLANISLLRRTLASANIQNGMVQNSPLVRNPGFEIGPVGAGYPKSSIFWDKSVTSGTGVWATSSAVVATGMKAIALSVTAGALTGDLSQQVGIETAAGEQFYAAISVKQLKTISSGTFRFFMEWADVNDALLTTSVQSLDGGGIDASFRTVQAAFAAPAGAVSLRTVGVRATALSPLTFGIFAYIDNVDVFVQPRNPKYPYPLDQAFRRNEASTGLVVEDKAGNFSSLAALLGFDLSTPASEGRAFIERKDQDYSGANLPPALALFGRLFQLGSKLLGTEANSLKPRVSADISTAAGVDFTLMWESGRNGETTGTYTQPAVRIYGSNDGQWVLTSNAIWDGTTWAKDVAAQNATKIGLAKDGLRIFTRVSDVAWSDTAWADTIRVTNPLETATDAQTARVSGGLYAGGATDFTLISQWRFAAGVGIRVYASLGATPQPPFTLAGSVGLYIVFNASWDGANWNKDVSGRLATRFFIFTPPDLATYFPTTRYEMAISPDTFAESGWSAPDGGSSGGTLWAGRVAAGALDSATGIASPSIISDAILSSFPNFQNTPLSGSAVMPGADLFATAPEIGGVTQGNFRLDSIGVFSPPGAYIFEEFYTGGIPIGFLNNIGGAGVVTYNINGKTRVQFAGVGGGSAGIISVATLVGAAYATVSFTVRFDDLLGASFFGLIDGAFNQVFGFVQDSVTYGNENIRVVIRTGAGLQALDTGVNPSSSTAWFVMTAYCWGGVGTDAANSRVYWRIGFKKTNGSGVWNPGGPVVNGDTALKMRILIGPSALVSVERFTIYGRSEFGL
jgi:hypothetical protein